MDLKKAHASKKFSFPKESKSEEAMKKQLKQMLYGYKHNDNKIINSCNNEFDPSRFDEDSSSVSGFSDLNLTNSSNEVESIHDSEEFHYESEDISDADDSSQENSSKSPHELSISYEESESHLQCDKQDVILADSISQDSTFNGSDNLSIFSCSVETASENETNDSDFDADGLLANKILENLEQKVNTSKNNKRKLKCDDKMYKCGDDTVKHNNKEKMACKSPREHPPSDETSNYHNIEENVIDNISESNCSSNSSAFISIVASEMPHQSFNEIIGEYKHATVKNLPTDSQNISTNSSSMFSIDNANVELPEKDDSFSPETEDNTVDNISSNIDDEDVESRNDSLSVYNNTFLSEDTSEKEDSDVLDNMRNSVSVYYGKSNCIFVLRHPIEIYIQGKVKIKAIGGNVELFGYTLQDKPCDVYAPNYNYVHCLKTLQYENMCSGLFSKLTSEGLIVSEAEEIVTGLGEYDAVISLRKLHSRTIDFVENNMPGTDLFSKSNKFIPNCLKKASDILKCSIFLRKPQKILHEVTGSSKAIECGLSDQSRGIICGGKGVGKSTTLRYLVNRLLCQGPVLVIDLDPGQAEFTVAGNISATVVDRPLIGPSFTHLKTPEMMFNLGMINTMDNPRRYTAAVAALIDYCHGNEHLKPMPWIINTMGMTNAMGLKFMAFIIAHTRPTYLLQIDSRSPKCRFEVNLDCDTLRRLYGSFRRDKLFRNVDCASRLDYVFIAGKHPESAGKINFSLPPRDERYLNYLAYFGDLVASRESNVILGVVPYEVNLRELHIGLNVKIAENDVTKVINGKIISLCQLTWRDNDARVFTLGDKGLVCHGHGLIRGVDMERQIVYIITPVPIDTLSQVNTLVYADWVPEIRGQERQLPEGIAVPYRTSTVYHNRQLMFAPRRRFNPLQLLKMTRSS